MLPGGRWHVHDSDRPLPPVITPGTCSTQETPGKAPSDALVPSLTARIKLSGGANGEGPAQWNIEDHALVILRRFRCDPEQGGIW